MDKNVLVNFGGIVLAGIVGALFSWLATLHKDRREDRLLEQKADKAHVESVVSGFGTLSRELRERLTELGAEVVTLRSEARTAWGREDTLRLALEECKQQNAISQRKYDAMAARVAELERRSPDHETGRGSL